MKHALRVTVAAVVLAVALEVAVAYGVLFFGPPETLTPW